MIDSLAGEWQAEIGDGKTYRMELPGTLDENEIGGRDSGKNQWHPDSALGALWAEFGKDGPILTRLTRKHTYEGEARLTRRISFAWRDAPCV